MAPTTANEAQAPCGATKKAMATRTRRARAAGRLLVAATITFVSIFGATRPAHAYYGWYGYETFGYAPAPVYVTGTRPILSVANQYYDVTLRGVRRLCENQPDLCAEPNLQTRLLRLERERIAGITMAWTGMATAVLGPLISTSVNCARSDTTCRPNDWIVLGTVVGGLAVGITGLVLTPSVHDVIELVNQINRTAPAHPVQLHFGLLDGQMRPGQKKAAQVAISAKF